MRTLRLVFFLTLLALPINQTLGMTSTNFAIPSDSMNGGGGDTSSSTNYKIRDTSGQAAIGPTNSSNFAAEQGYRTRETSSQLSAAFVDASGNDITTPIATFTSITSGATSASGNLATSSSKIRITNTRTVATWSLTIAATSGPTATWVGGLDYNNPVGGQALTVNPSSAVIAPVGMLCSSGGLTSGTSAAFDQGVIDSITLLSAGGGAMTGCAWDMTNIGLTQTIPTSQAAGSYSISMTITVA